MLNYLLEDIIYSKYLILHHFEQCLKLKLIKYVLGKNIILCGDLDNPYQGQHNPFLNQNKAWKVQNVITTRISLQTQRSMLNTNEM